MNTLRTATVAAGLALAAAATAAAVGSPAASATQAAAKPQRSCVGAWEVKVGIDPARPPQRVLVSFFADGNVMLGQQGALRGNVPGGADVELNSPGHGSWKPAGSRGSCAFTVRIYSSDVTGADTGGATVTGAVSTTDRGNTLSGTAEFSTDLPDGGGFGPVPVTVTGSRIVP